MSEIQELAQQRLEVMVYFLLVGYSFGAGMDAIRALAKSVCLPVKKR